MNWLYFGIGLYVILTTLLLFYLKKNWSWFKATYETIYSEKQKVAKKILEAQDGKEKKKLLKENIFKIF